MKIISPAPIMRQRGIALMTVLIILAIATVVLVSMSGSRQLDIRRTENLLRAAQAWEYLYSVENWAATVLQQDLADNKADSFADAWAKPFPETPAPDGKLQAGLTDLQGRFNLNNLWLDDHASEIDVQRFQRLLVLLKIKPTLIAAILDWIDPDMDIRYPHGAEDETYLQYPTPYRSANRLFSDVSELLLIHGMTRDDYNKLKPYVYVIYNYAPMNVNTADPLLLRCLTDKLSEDDTDSLIRAIKDAPFEKIEDFLKRDTVAKLGITKEGLGVTSSDFLLSGSIQIGKISLMFDSQLKREDSGQTAIVKRMRRSPTHG
jgi:general secretion pathway protein K